jgi:hypothetical protein
MPREVGSQVAAVELPYMEKGLLVQQEPMVRVRVVEKVQQIY